MIKRYGRNASGQMMGGLLTFALFGLFVVLSLLIVVIGVEGYRNVVDAGEMASEIRTSMGYLLGKIRSESSTDGARIETYEGGLEALVLTQYNDEGEPLETIIYHQDGALYEAYNNAAVLDFDPRFGTRLVEIASFIMEQPENGLFRFTATATDGQSLTVHSALRAGGGGEDR